MAGPVTVELPKARWWEWRRRQTGRRFAFAVSERAQSSPLLDDAVPIADTIDLLISASLLTRRPEGLIMHPLIGFVLREAEPDPLPWIEIGISLFAADLQTFAADTDDPRAMRHMDHIAALVKLATAAHHYGPAVIAVASELVVYLGLGGQVVPPIDIDAAATLATDLIQETHRQITAGWVPFTFEYNQRRSLGAILFHAGRIGAAIDELYQLIAVANEIPGQSHSVAGAWSGIASIATQSGSLDFARSTLVSCAGNSCEISAE